MTKLVVPFHLEVDYYLEEKTANPGKPILTLTFGVEDEGDLAKLIHESLGSFVELTIEQLTIEVTDE